MNHCNIVNSLNNYLHIYRLYYINKKNKILLIIFIARLQIQRIIKKNLNIGRIREINYKDN